MFELVIHTHFAAAHYLREYEGKCEALHGHNWRVEVRVQADGLNSLGMVMDFGDVKPLINQVVDELDHKCLNDLPAFQEVNPTTENIAKHIYTQLAGLLPDSVRVSRVTAWETDCCGAAYFEPQEE